MIRSVRILYSLAVLLAAFVLSGCAKSAYEQTEKLVTLQISLDAKGITKAESSDAEKSIGSVRIYAYRKDTGSQVGHYYRGQASAEPIYMDLALPERGQHDVEFVLIVNETSVRLPSDFAFAERMSKEKVMQARFTSVEQGGAIPFYCEDEASINVESVYENLSSLPGHEGHNVLVQKMDFTLSSSIAKLSVYAAMAEGVSSTKIQYVGILKGGLRQYVYFLPVDDQTLAAVPERAIGRDLMTTEVVLTRNAAHGSQNTEDYNLLVADHYIPETEVGSEFLDVKASDRQATVHVQYSVGEGGELRNGYIYLPRIDRGTHYNVCLLVTSEGRIILSYKVAPWDKVDMNELWFDYPTHSFLEDDVEGEKPSAPATMSLDKPFVGYFKMSFPSTETWRPTILGDGVKKADVKVYNGLTPVEPPVMADDRNWYRIEVTPHDDLLPGSEVELGITYSPDFSVSGQYEFLLINGSQNNWYWPYEGESAQDANKVIITVTE